VVTSPPGIADDPVKCPGGELQILRRCSAACSTNVEGQAWTLIIANPPYMMDAQEASLPTMVEGTWELAFRPDS